MENEIREALGVWVELRLSPELARRRWFRGRGRAISRVSIHDAFVLTRHDSGEACDVRLIALVEVCFEDGGQDLYQVPVEYEHAENSISEPVDGAVWTDLCHAFLRGDPVVGARGTLEFERRLDGARPSGDLTATVLTQDQTNTSFFCGDLIYGKLYRCPEIGESRETECADHLTRVAGRGRAVTPAYRGSVHHREDGETRSCAIFFDRVREAEILWDICRRDLRDDDGRRRLLTLTAEAGSTVGRMHQGLSSMPTVPVRDEEGSVLVAGIRELAERAKEICDAFADSSSTWLNELSVFVDKLGALEGCGRPIPIHGDLHLGQVLLGADGHLWVIDFEGEPHRPVHERNSPRSPLKDVAGMLRSFSYARLSVDPDDEALVRWESDARSAFLDSYWSEVGGAEWAPTSENRRELLALYEMEKALYEILYEFRQRPDFVWIPITGLIAILGRVESKGARP